MLYNTCLRPDNERFRKDRVDETHEMEGFIGRNSFYRYEHIQRRWEYGQAMRLIKQYKPKTMLNVGGGNSPISTWAVERGVAVTEIDPNRPSRLLPGITYIHEEFPVKDLSRDFELVICTSVIEHIPKDDMHFFKALLDHSKELVLITMDFHPSGKPFSYAHYRTYSPTDLELMINIAKIRGFSPVGDVDYRYDGPMVYDYTFASLALIKDV